MESVAEVPLLSVGAKLPFLKVSVGSEMACMLRPSFCWVANKKTVWAYLTELYGGNVRLAFELLDSFTEGGMIDQIYAEMEPQMRQISLRQPDDYPRNDLQRDEFRFLWSDAICCRCDEVYKS